MTLVPFLHQGAGRLPAAAEIGPARRFFLQEFVPRETLNEKFASVKPFSPEKMRAIRERLSPVSWKIMPLSAVIYTSSEAFFSLRDAVRNRCRDRAIKPYTFSFAHKLKTGGIRVRATELSQGALMPW